MGICDFYVEAKAKTPEEAFATAVAQAKEVYGEGSHTGSIAEKTDFILIEDSITDVNSRFDTRLIAIARQPNINIEEYKQFKREERAVRDAKSEFRYRPKKRGRDKAYATAYALISADDDRINAPDKPAGIIRCTVGNYLLFGITNE